MSLNYRKLPRVAIIGRPNVGKSTLFNLLTETRKSVVKDQPGVTRDLIFANAEIWGKEFELIDTGGITESQDIFSKLIREQVVDFLDSADLLLVVMDGRSGLIPEDRDIVKLAAETGKPFLLIINKVDSQISEEEAAAEFYEFGRPLVITSFERRRGLSELLEWLHKNLAEAKADETVGLAIAVAGKPNAGKSSLVNCLLGESRMLVSDIAGTTIDSVDTPLEHNGRLYTLIDTAGLRKSSKRNTDLEIISAFKSQESIRRADVVLLVVDSLLGPTDQDAKILEASLELHKPVILVLNKSDLGAREIPEFRSVLQDRIDREFHFFRDIPKVFVSAKTGSGIRDLFAKIEWMNEKLQLRISTGELNEFFMQAIRKAPSPVFGVTNVKFYYLTQTQQRPPAFIAFANHPEGVDPSYRRFLINQMKERFDLHGIPLRIFVMKSQRSSR